MANKNQLNVCVKTSGQSAFELFNANHKVRHVVDWGVKNFKMNPKPAQPYVAFLEATPQNVLLQLDGNLADQQVRDGSCIIIQAPVSPDG